MKLIFILYALLFLYSCHESEKILVYKTKKTTEKRKKSSYRYGFLPSDWKVAPNTSAFRLGTLLTEKDEEITLIELPENSGSLISNVNRWLGQIEASSMNENELPSITSHHESQLGQFSFLDMKGKNKTIFLCLFHRQEKKVKLFVKLLTSKENSTVSKNPFLKFCQGLSQ